MLIFKKHNSHGFTLLEILLVIGIIAILAGIVIVAINPSKQLATVRNTQRKSDLKQIYNAITQYYIDNSSFPSTISTTTLNEVCNTGSVASTTVALNGDSCGTLANLSVLVPTYLVAIPTDPTGTSSLLSFIPTAYAATTATGTGYKVGINTAKQVLISAPLAELGVTVTVGNVPTTVASTLGNGLLAHYLMNDNAASATVLDTTTNYNGTARQNTSALTTAGKINTALRFNGSSDYVGLGTSSGLDFYTAAFTISAWINPANATQGQVIYSSGISADKGVQLVLRRSGSGTDGNFIDLQKAGVIDVAIAVTISNTVWSHIVMTQSFSGGHPSSVSLYVNGAFIGSATNTSDYTSASGQTKAIGYGGTPGGGAAFRYFNGNIDDVRIYNRVLTPTEITQLHNDTAGTETE
ncbi:MAG: LamG-like jellyroll fold domain-containing protein [bacterium]